MENGFDPLLVSEGHVTVGLKAIFLQRRMRVVGRHNPGLPPAWPGGLTIQERSTIENKLIFPAVGGCSRVRSDLKKEVEGIANREGHSVA
jgi:hypothetical protein